MSNTSSFPASSRHGVQGSNGSRGSHYADCVCTTHGCQCLCWRHDLDTESGYAMVLEDDKASDDDRHSVTDSIYEPPNPNQPDRYPEGECLDVRATRPTVSRATTAPPQLEEHTTLTEPESVVRHDGSRHDDLDDHGRLSRSPWYHDGLFHHEPCTSTSPPDSMIVEVCSRTPNSSMENSMCISFITTTSRRSSVSPMSGYGSGAGSILYGIGAHFDRVFIYTPLPLSPDPADCLPSRSSRRSLSLPAVQIDGASEP